MDLVLPVQRLPRAGETLAGGDLALNPGGKGANQAVAAARLGGDVIITASVGADAFGETLLQSLRDSGVNTDRVKTSSRPTGCASIYVMPGGANSIVVSPGANADLDPASAVSALHDLTQHDFLLAQLETPLETVEAAFAYASRIGAMTILDPAPARMLPQSLIANASLITPNQTEAGVLLGDPDLRIETFEQAEWAAARLTAMGFRGVTMKLGSLGCMCSPLRVAALPVEAVDTTAAGDVFNAALAVALAEGRSMEHAMRFGNAAAALSVTRRGAQNSAPCRADVEHILASGGV